MLKRILGKKEKDPAKAEKPGSASGNPPAASAPPLPAKPPAVSKSSGGAAPVAADSKANSYGAITTGLGGAQDPSQLKPEPGKAEYLEGERWLNLGQYYKALECYNQAVAHYLPAHYRLFYIWYFCLQEEDKDKIVGLNAGVVTMLSVIEKKVLDNTSTDPIDYFSVACCKYYSCGVNESDPIKAVKLLTIAAESGHGFAQTMLAKCLLKGKGVDRDLDKAIYWLNKAADQGIAEAEFELGICYRDAVGVKQNFKTALQLVERAANKDFMDAQNVLGNAYYLGKTKGGSRAFGLHHDFDKAFQYYKGPADKGHVKATCNLGNCYFYGRGVGKDVAKGRELWQQAADKGLPAAAQNLGIKDVPKKKPKRKLYFHSYYYSPGIRY